MRDFLEGDDCASSSQPFGQHALALRERGLAVVPCGRDAGKGALMEGWQRRKSSVSTIAGWARKHADANIGVACGLSGLVVVDVDDRAAVPEMLKRFGDTPLITPTPRGAHLWYRKVNAVKSGNLKRQGLPVDIKADRGMVIVPPSFNRLSGVPYAFERGSWDDLARLPAFRREALAPEIPQPSAVGEAKSGAIGEGERNNNLFRYLMRAAHTADVYSALLAAARSFNSDYLSPRLPDSEVEKTASSVWRYHSEGRNWVGSHGRVVWPVEKVLECGAHKHAGDAIILTTVLRAKHAKRKAPFAVAPRAMAKAQVIPGWSEHRYRTALKAALELQLIKPVHKGGRRKGDASLYQLAPHV